MIRSRLAPIARRMPISFCFCTTHTTSTLAIPSATTRVTNNRIVPVLMFWLRIAASSCALVVIQLSASSPVSRSRRAATASALKISRTVSSIVETPPGRSRSVCASFSVTNTQRWLRSLLPRSKMPATVITSSRPSGVPIRIRSPTATPRSFASSIPITPSVPDSRNSPATMSSLMRTIRR